MASLLGDSLNIPTTGITTGAIDYTLPTPITLVEESSSAIQSTYGGTGFFQRQGQGLPSYASAAVPTVSTSQYTANTIKSAVGEPQRAENTYHKVTLTAIGDDLNFSEVVEFDIMPTVGEVRSVDYESLSPPQLPGEFQKYRGTKSVQWTITGTFTCRTQAEAHRNLQFINRLRAWTMPYFGDKQKIYGRLGAPPPVLKFSGWRGLVGEVPVVMTAANWSWPKDCDWIPTYQRDEKNSEWVPFPTVMDVTINITESFSALQFNNFDLYEFHDGRMIAAYGTEYVQPAAPPTGEQVGGLQGVTNSVPQPTPVQKTVPEARRQKSVSTASASTNVAAAQNNVQDYIDNMNQVNVDQTGVVINTNPI